MGFEDMPQPGENTKSPELQALLERVQAPNKTDRKFLTDAILQLTKEEEIREFYEAYAQSIVREFPEAENPEHTARQNISYFLMNIGGEEKERWDKALPDPEETLRNRGAIDPTAEHGNVLEG